MIRRENKNGRLLRSFADRVGFTAVNTRWTGGSGPTYFRSTSTGSHRTRVDYVLLPQSGYAAVHSCDVLLNEGLRLQHTKTMLTFLVDHVPLRVRLLGTPYLGPRDKRTRRRIDQAALALDAQQAAKLAKGDAVLLELHEFLEQHPAEEAAYAAARDEASKPR